MLLALALLAVLGLNAAVAPATGSSPGGSIAEFAAEHHQVPPTRHRLPRVVVARAFEPLSRIADNRMAPADADQDPEPVRPLEEPAPVARVELPELPMPEPVPLAAADVEALPPGPPRRAAA